MNFSLHIPFKNIFKLIFSFLSIIIIIIFFWFFRYRNILLVSTKKTPHLYSSKIEGYSDKQFYFIGDTIKLYLRTESDNNTLLISKIKSSGDIENIFDYNFDKTLQYINSNQSEKGCNWNLTTTIPIDKTFTAGYYIISLNNYLNNEFTFPIIVGDKNKISKIAILAPTSTWTAYNAWGGKSLYNNVIDSTNVYFASNQRPNSNMLKLGDNVGNIFVESNIYNWLDKTYNVTIYPDNILDNHKDILNDVSIIVLSYHCEYISEPTYDRLSELVNIDGKSLISLGGNQIYWKVKWNANYTIMECRKDLTFFENSFEIGGMWRHNLRNEEKLLGVRYTKAGIHTFAPYKIQLPMHWLFKNINLPSDGIFGKHGLNGLPLSGLETDKTTIFTSNNVDILAKGMNPENGGADFIYKEYKCNNAVLSTGSINSGAGLGHDYVFTQIINNFISKYNSSN